MTRKRTGSGPKGSMAEGRAPTEQSEEAAAGQGQDDGGRTQPAAAPERAAPRPTKASLLLQMLSAPGGTTLAALSEATGWQAHTVRATLSRLRRSGHAVERGRSNEGETTYRIVLAERAGAATGPDKEKGAVNTDQASQGEPSVP